MDKKREEVYVGGAICLLCSILSGIFAGNLTISIGWNISSIIFWVSAGAFGVFGIGSFLKPDSFGVVVLKLIETLAESQAEGSNSHNQQTQKKSSGSVQVMASDDAEVHVNVTPREKKQAQNLPQEEKEILCKDKIVVGPSKGYSYEFEFMKGEHLKGEISSTSPIDIHFVDEFDFDKWNRDKSFDSERSSVEILETNIDYLAPAKGTWYLIIENKGRKSATVKVQLY
jgi:hypothetical protein